MAGEDVRTADAVADTMAATPGSGSAPTGPPVAVSDDASELRVIDPGAYELGRELARGGMGRIVEAIDRRHHRPVAIKMLLRDDVAVERFVREATITSQLQHPAIVPVYEAGRWPTGEPFFAMKLVEGRSLDRAIAQAPDLGARLTLLPKLVAVSEALAYAHGRGVIHRDLKPHNVLCGDFGETVVIDWGLAKRIGTGDALDRSDDGSTSGDDLTVVGDAMGTPRYMPPEQARGGAVDARCDVYSLGAMIYHLVSGAPPYEGHSSAATVERVLEGPPPPLAERVPGAPPDLCTIVAKAMARDPAERYATASDLADELRRFTSGRRVAAHDYSLAALVRRFVARNRVTVGVAAALLAVLLITSVVMVQRIMRARDHAADQRVLAEQQRNSALAERAAAEELVDFIQSELRERLEPIGRIELLEGVAGRVEAYYRATGSNDAAAQARRASALTMDGEVAAITDDLVRAERSHRAALALRLELARLQPEDAAAQRQLALAHLQVAKSVEDRNDLVGAMPDYDAGLVAARRAVELAPTDVDAQLALVDALSAKALALDTSGRGADSHAMLVQALDLARTAAAAAPEHRDRLAEVLELLGDAMHQRGRHDDGLALTREALVIRRELADRAPGDTRPQGTLARTFRMLARGLRETGADAAALTAYRDERAILERLLTVEPEQTRWQFFLAENHLDVGDELRGADDSGGAEREYLAALAIAGPRAAKLPDDGNAQFALANVRSALGDLLTDREDLAALVHYQAAQAILDGLVTRAPEMTRWRYAAARSRGVMAGAYATFDDLSRATVEVVIALDELDRMLVAEPDASVYLDLRAELAVFAFMFRNMNQTTPMADLLAAARRAVVALEAKAAQGPLPASQAEALTRLRAMVATPP